MKIVVDESVPEDLTDRLPGHEAKSVGQLGWKGTKNGKLLKLVELIEADVFITSDKSLHNQQVIAGRSFAVLLLSTNNWRVMEPNVTAIHVALTVCKPGVGTHVDCGRFVRRRLPRPQGPPI